MIKVGFIGAVSKDWMGGLNYFKNLLFAIDTLKNKELQVFVFVGKKTDEEIKEMDDGALEFWKQWKVPLLVMCAAHRG